MPEQSDKFNSHPDDVQRSQYFDAPPTTPDDTQDLYFKVKSDKTVNVLGAPEDLKNISTQSTEQQVDMYFDQQRTAAFMTDVLFEAEVLRQSTEVPEAVRNEIQELMKTSVWNVQKLQVRIAELKGIATPTGKTYDTIIRERVASRAKDRAAEKQGSTELETRAHAYVEEFLRERIFQIESSARLEIRRYQFIPDQAGNPALDEEKIVPVATRPDVNYTQDSAVRHVFPSVDLIQKAFVPILEREVRILLARERHEDQRLEKTQVELRCADVIADVLYSLNKSTESKASVFSRVNASSADPRGALLGMCVREQTGTSKRKADRLRLERSAYLDPKEIRPEQVTPQIVEDTNKLLEAVGIPSRVAVETAYPPIDAQILSGLEMLLDESGATKEIINSERLVAVLMSTESGLPAKMTPLEDLRKWQVVTEYKIKRKDLESAQFDLKSLQEEISTFLRSQKKQVASLAEIVEERGLFGGGIKNQDVIIKRDGYLARQKKLEDTIAKLTRETSQKPSEPYKDQEALRNALREKISYYEEVGFEVHLPTLAPPNATSGEIPIIRIKLGKNALKGLDIDPLDTFEERMRQKVDVAVTELLIAFDRNIKAIIAKLTANYDKTRGVMERVTNNPNANQIVKDVLAYGMGGMYSTSDHLSLNWEQEAFFYAAREHARPASSGADFIVPDNIKPQFEALKLLKN